MELNGKLNGRQSKLSNGSGNMEEVTKRKPRYWTDETNELQDLANEIIGDDFELLSTVRITYSWRDPARTRFGRLILGECRKYSNKDRDLFGKDINISMAFKPWKEELSDAQKRRLMWHELYHIEVQANDAMVPEVDDNGRVKIKIRKHDLNLERFEEELKKFGPNAEEKVTIKRLFRVYKQFKDAVESDSREILE